MRSGPVFLTDKQPSQLEHSYQLVAEMSLNTSMLGVLTRIRTQSVASKDHHVYRNRLPHRHYSQPSSPRDNLVETRRNQLVRALRRHLGEKASRPMIKAYDRSAVMASYKENGIIRVEERIEASMFKALVDCERCNALKM